MAATITFNLIKDGIVGHVNVTITRDDYALTLGNSADLGAFPMGQYSPSFEMYRSWASINLIRKTLTIEDSTFDKINTYFKTVEGNQTHYGFYYAVNCIDFTQTAYEMTGADGHFSDLFSNQELSGPIVGKLMPGNSLDWLMPAAFASQNTGLQDGHVQADLYRSPVDGEFGISGGIVILAVLLTAFVLNRIISGKLKPQPIDTIRRIHALVRATAG